MARQATPGLTVHAADGNGTRILAESSHACIQVCRLIGISAVPPGSRTGASDLYLVPIVDSCERLLQEFTSQKLAQPTNIYALYSEAVCVSPLCPPFISLHRLVTSLVPLDRR